MLLMGYVCIYIYIYRGSTSQLMVVIASFKQVLFPRPLPVSAAKHVEPPIFIDFPDPVIPGILMDGLPSGND